MTAAFVPLRRTRSLLRPAAMLVVAALALLGLGRVGDLLPSLANPFDGRTVDRSAPAVLAALEDVARFDAATANYSVVVDLEKDTRWVPAFVKGERTVFLARGSVDASVDLSGLDATAVTTEGTTVRVALPAATVAPAVVDPEQSRVVSRDRGIVDRVGSVFADSPTGERDLYLAAAARLDRAAAADGALVRRAQANTRAMLERLLRPLGFERVEVVFASP